MADTVTSLQFVDFAQRNKYGLIGLVYDFGFEIAFLISNAHDISSLYIPSLVFFFVPAGFNFMMGLIIFIIERCRPDNRTVPENTQFNAIITFCCAIDIQTLRLISSGFGGLEPFNYEFSNNAMKTIAWTSVINAFIEDIPQLIILVLYTQKNGFIFIPFASLILCTCVLATSLERLFYAIDNGPCTRDCFTIQRRNERENRDFQRDWEL
ncbi:hypothetical protein C2G38_532224 [Gigaspora rosea]|uniref:Uncharacterized protein n=1 Tax=Gigaspora rosea TaxID=44941 RepID=A0A397UBT9_9GLOM|nr:hypothetical protein C2G38_532224 [Gigaspora rosea]